MRFLTFALIGAVISGASTSAVAGDRSSILFDRDIRPILSDACFGCHGPDPRARKGRLRVDTREGLERPRKDGAPVLIPGRPAESELLRRITATDPEERMPPPDSGKTLDGRQIETIRRWIEPVSSSRLRPQGQTLQVYRPRGRW